MDTEYKPLALLTKEELDWNINRLRKAGGSAHLQHADALQAYRDRRYRENGGFGGCPICDGDDGYLNIGRVHFFVCDEHSTYWCAGSNLFSSWKDETEADWARNAKVLDDGYRPTGKTYRDSLQEHEKVWADKGSDPWH